MKTRIILSVILLTAVYLNSAEIKTFGGAEFQILPDGKIQVSYQPGKGWPQIRIPIPDRKWGTGEMVMTIRQVKPERKLSYGITIGTVNPKNALQGSYIHQQLQHGKAVRFNFPEKGTVKPDELFIAAKNPTEISVLEISGIETMVSSLSVRKKKMRMKPLPAVQFKGKPIFPIGAYDMHPTGGKAMITIDPGFLEAGGNFADFGVICMPWTYYNTHSQPAIFSALETIKNDKRFENVALLVGLGWNLLMDDAETPPGKWGMNTYVTPPRGVSLEKRRQELTEAVKKLRSYPNVIGYTMDEPENLIWQYYKKHYSDDWEKNKDKGLSAKMLEWIGWTNEIIRKNHPGALRMPIIAWWTNYLSAAPLYDVLIANTYVKVDKEEFSGPLYDVSYDAAMQVDAVRRAGGGRTAIFMPQMYDNLNGIIRPLTLREQRYVNFAPITRGVMGIYGWRLQRCSSDYRKSVIYPAMKEVSLLSSFFLGEWHDELVSSDHDTATADYLKKFKVRIRLVEGEEEDDNVFVKDIVPDVTYCLRKHPDGRHLLLVANNRREPLTVKFQLDLKNLPAHLQDVLDGHRVRVNAKQGTFQDTFAPFDIHAYIISAN